MFQMLQYKLSPEETDLVWPIRTSLDNFAANNVSLVIVNQLAKDFYGDLKVVVADAQVHLKNLGKDVDMVMADFVAHLMKFKQFTTIDHNFVRYVSMAFPLNISTTYN